MLHLLGSLLAALFPRRPAPTRVLVPVPVLIEEDRGRYHPYPAVYPR